jgi:DNA repair exonuclease SbcCD ATPase subunit
MLFPSVSAKVYEDATNADVNSLTPESYIKFRLKITDKQEALVKELEQLVKKLKEINHKKAHIINSTIETLGLIISGNEIVSLVEDLEQIKQSQIEISSYKGGSLQEILGNIAKQCQISKQIEFIQSRIEASLYIEDLENIVTNSEELTDIIANLIEEKNSLHKTCETIENETNQFIKNEAEPISLKKSALEEEYNSILADVQSLMEFTVNLKNNQKSIEEFHTKIREADLVLRGLREKIEELRKEKEMFQQIVKMTNKLKKKVETKANTLANLHQELETLKNESAKNFVDV